MPGGGAQVFRAADRSVFGPVHFAGRAVLRVRLAPDHRTLAVCGEAIGAQLVHVETGSRQWEIAAGKETVRLASRERLCATVNLGGGVIYECRFSADGSAITLAMPGGAFTLDAASGRPAGEKMQPGAARSRRVLFTGNQTRRVVFGHAHCGRFAGGVAKRVSAIGGTSGVPRSPAARGCAPGFRTQMRCPLFVPEGLRK